jgi:tRNA modification GTPase
MRQLNVIKDFLALLEESRDTILQAEIAADLLADANRMIGSLTGEHTTEELLGQIFSTFCIGK